MFELFLLIVLVGAILIVNTLGSPKTIVKRDCSDVPPGQSRVHKWVEKNPPDHAGYLVCKVCGKVPGEP